MNATTMQKQNLAEMNVTTVSSLSVSSTVSTMLFFVKLSAVMGVMILGLASAYF
jgi:hypothetical protein